MTLDLDHLKTTRAAMLAEGSMFELGTLDKGGESFTSFKHAPANLVEIIQSGRAHGQAELFADQTVGRDERYSGLGLQVRQGSCRQAQRGVPTN